MYCTMSTEGDAVNVYVRHTVGSRYSQISPKSSTLSEGDDASISRTGAALALRQVESKTGRDFSIFFDWSTDKLRTAPWMAWGPKCVAPGPPNIGRKIGGDPFAASFPVEVQSSIEIVRKRFAVFARLSNRERDVRRSTGIQSRGIPGQSRHGENRG